MTQSSCGTVLLALCAEVWRRGGEMGLVDWMAYNSDTPCDRCGSDGVDDHSGFDLE
jgi:hypothetical protein